MPFSRPGPVLIAVAVTLFATAAIGSEALGAEPVTTAPARAERARAAAEKVLSDPRYQRTRPDGSLSSPPPDRPPRPPREPRAPSRYEPSQASGVSTALLWVIGGIFATGLLLVLGRELLLAQRRRRRKKSRGGPDNLEQLIIDSHAQALPASLAAEGAVLEDPGTVLWRYRRSEARVGAFLAHTQAAGLEIADLSTKEADLEDIFLQLTAKGRPAAPVPA